MLSGCWDLGFSGRFPTFNMDPGSRRPHGEREGRFYETTLLMECPVQHVEECDHAFLVLSQMPLNPKP